MIKILKIYKTNNEDEKRKSYIINVNGFLYTTRVVGGIIKPLNQLEEYLLESFNDKVELSEYEIIFNKKIPNKIIENIITTVMFDNGFLKKPYFDLKRKKVTHVKEKDDESCLKSIYKELINYIDLSLYTEDFIRKKEKTEKQFNLL